MEKQKLYDSILISIELIQKEIDIKLAEDKKLNLNNHIFWKSQRCKELERAKKQLTITADFMEIL